MKTTLALIGKNEAQGLRDLMGDVGKYFDEIVLVSTDHNKELIKTGKELGCKVYDEYFGKTGVDFDTAEARNFSFDKIRNISFGKATGDIIAWFDLDDRIPNGYVIPYIFEAIESGKADWVYCTYNYAFNREGEVIVQHVKPRFFRKGTLKWQKTVHEDAVALKNVKQVLDKNFLVEPLIVNHQNIWDENKVKERSTRNLGLLLKEYNEDGDKTDLRTIQNIGTTYVGIGEFEKAIEFLLRHYRSTGAQEDKFWSLTKVAFCLKMLGKYDEAINTLLEALKIIPRWSTIYFDLADVYSRLGDYDKVIEWTNAGLTKQYPDTLNMIQPRDYDVHALGRLADAYLMLGNYDKAYKIALSLEKSFPKNKLVKELVSTCYKSKELERFVSSFLFIADSIRKEDRLKAIKLFDCLPDNLDDDIRIQASRFLITPPKTWGDNSIVIYCGKSLENWAYPSIFTGIGGSEEAVINMSIQLNKLGYKVTIYNNCGILRGEYDGVEYKPYYHFNPKDSYNTLIAWRNPQLFDQDIKANKKIVWLHDIAQPFQFTDKGVENTDKFIFLSKWHRSNMPSIPEEKIFISNNGIDPDDFKGDEVKKPYSLFWGSSYDRGLLPFIKNIWPIIKKELPETTLDVYYGWQNIDKELKILPELKLLRHELTPLLENSPGITEHGRIGHKELAEVMKSSICYPYASEFGETNNITSQKCQASGCYVITTSQAGGTPERIKFGKVVEGNDIYTDKNLQEKFAKEVIEYLKNPKDAPEGIVEGFSWASTAKTWKEGLLCME